MKKHIRFNLNRIISCALLVMLVSGCAHAGGTGADADQTARKNADTVSDEDVELIEPAGSALSYVTAEVRDLARVTTYQGVVCPATFEYSYESDQPFGNYCALPGDTVSAGDMLFYGAVDGIDEQIEDIEDENVSLLVSYNDYVSDYMVDLAKAKKEEFEAASAYMDMKNYEPDEDSPYYMGWAKGVMPLENRAKQTKMAREKMEEAYLERQQTFDLDYSYNETRISRLEEDKTEAGVTSSTDGVVVAANYYYPGDTVKIGSNIIAVGDTSDMEIVCDYISKSVINKAVSVYAIIDGSKYEVGYVNMEPEEYRRLKQTEDEVYTRFKISDTSGKVTLGAYAVIVIEEFVTSNALCVPKDAVGKDETGSFVYMYVDGESVYTPVTTGESDSGFTQILSGLKDGDKVVYDVPYDVGTKTATITRGSVSTDFSVDGYLMYPTAEWMVNPAKNGVCYLTERCVDKFEQVTEGQTLAKIEVVADTIEIDRIKRKIQRENERIADLNTKLKTTYDKDAIAMIERAVRDRNRTLESLNKQLNKTGKYSGVFELKAPYSGIIIDVADIKAGEIISFKQQLVQLAGDSSCYIIAEDQGGVLSYGDSATVTVKDNTGNTYETNGMVVSLNPIGLSKSMRTGYALVRVSQEDMSAMTGSGSDISNGYWYRIRFSVSAQTKNMNNVLLIPKTAVYKTGSDTYVVTKDENGASKLIRFVAGGSDNANYWVAYGDITEGMSICLV